MIRRVLIMAGGTGGHIFPALAIAELLQQKEITIAWLGTPQGLEAKLVPQARIPLYPVKIYGLCHAGWQRWLSAPIDLALACLQSIMVIRHFRPDVVLGMGGFVSGPGGIAAWLLRKRLIIHEQNAALGLTNKILSRFARKILTGLPKAIFEKNNVTSSFIDKIIYTGNPVRQAISQIPKPSERFSQHRSPMHLLILGGSQGALSFNQIIPQAIAKYVKEMPEKSSLMIWHQAGEKYLSFARKNYQNMKLQAKVDSFIKDMASAYAWADLVICRAGASTIAELTAAGVPAILIPYPHAVYDHQTENARFLVGKNAAILLPQASCTVDVLSQLLKDTLNRDTLLKIAENAYKMRIMQARENIIKELIT